MGNSRRLMTLGDLGPIITGKTPSTKVPGHFGGAIPFVTPRDMDGRKTIDSTERYLTEKGVNAVTNAVIPLGSIMVSCIGSDMGKVAIAGRQCVTNQQINSIIVSEENIAEYVYYDLSRRKNELRFMASGSAQPILNKGHFSQVQIEMPELDEQRAIAHILGSLDDKIELNRQMNQTLEKMAQAIFKSWFIDFDPVRAKAKGSDTGLPKDIADLFPDSFEDSELGPIPKGWEVGDLQDLLVLQRGFDLPKKKRSPGKHPLIAASGQDGYHNEFKVNGPGVTTGRSGKLGIVTFVHSDFWPLNTTLWIKTYKKSNPYHAYFLLRTLKLETYNAGSAVPTLNRNHIHNLRLPVPSEGVLKCFFSQSQELFSAINQNIEQVNRLSRIRDILLPQLISGKLPIQDTEQFVGGEL